MTSKVNSLLHKFHEMYWSKPKSPDQAMTFLHFLASGNMARSHFRMFSHFSLHFKNLLYNPSFTSQSMTGPYMYGIYIFIFGIAGPFLLVDGWGLKNTSGSSELDLCNILQSSWHSFSLNGSCELLKSSWPSLADVLDTWTDLLVALGILNFF